MSHSSPALKAAPGPANTPAPDPHITLLTQKDLHRHLGVGRDFVLAMKFAGFPMPGGRATLAAAHKWLQENPDFAPHQHLLATRPSLQKKTQPPPPTSRRPRQA